MKTEKQRRDQESLRYVGEHGARGRSGKDGRK